MRPFDFRLVIGEKQFRDRAVRELREIGKQLLSWRPTTISIASWRQMLSSLNPRLSDNVSGVPAMMRGVYTDATTMGWRRLLARDANLSSRRLLAQISGYPDLLHDKLTAKQLPGEVGELERMAAYLKEHVDPHFTNHERTPAALATTDRELDRAIDLLIDCVKRYYWIVSDAYIDLDVSYSEDPLAVFRFAWIEPKSARSSAESTSDRLREQSHGVPAGIFFLHA